MTAAYSPKISIIIVNYRSELRLMSCLRSMRSQITHAEVIISDNGSDPELRTRVAMAFPSVRWIPMPGNIGFAAAANRGAAAARSSRFLFLNPDTVLARDTLSVLIQALDSSRFLGGIVGCALFDEGGAVQLSCRRFPDWRAVVANRFSLLTRLLPENSWSASYLMRDFDHRTVRRVDWVSGAAMAMHAATFRRLGGFNERYFLYFEDVDLCRRGSLCGIPTWYCPTVQMQHAIGGSSCFSPIRSLYFRHKSMWVYYRAYHRRPWLDPLVLAILAARFAVKSAEHLAEFGTKTLTTHSAKLAVE